jgi:hypothetical protein
VSPAALRPQLQQLQQRYQQQEQQLKQDAFNAEQQGKQAWQQAEQAAKQPVKGMDPAVVKALQDAGRQQANQEQKLKKDGGSSEQASKREPGLKALKGVQAELQAKRSLDVTERRAEEKAKLAALGDTRAVAKKGADDRLVSQQQELVAKRDDLLRAAKGQQEQQHKHAQQEQQHKERDKKGAGGPSTGGKAPSGKDDGKRLLEKFKAQQEQALAKHKEELTSLAQQEAARKAKVKA